MDTSGSLMWRMRQRGDMAGATGQVTGEQTIRKRHEITTTTRDLKAEIFYSDTRSNIELYGRGFADIRAFSDAYNQSIRNARMTDQEIEDLIERMNLSPR